VQIPGGDAGLVPGSYLQTITEDEVREFLKEHKKGKSKEELKNEMNSIKEVVDQLIEQEKVLEDELQMLKKQRHEAWVEYKNNVEQVDRVYYRISPEMDLFYTVRELIAFIDVETDIERDAEKITDQLIESISTFTSSFFDNDKLKPYRQNIDPMIAEIQNKLINQRANNDGKLAGSEFYELLVTLSDSLYHVINGGKVEELREMFPVLEEEGSIKITIEDKSEKDEKSKKLKDKKKR